MRPLLTVLGSSFLLLSACGPSRKIRKEHIYMDTVSVSATNNQMKLYRASADKVWNLVHTRVALSFDYADKTASGKAWLTLNPYFYATDTLVLDAKGMKIESVADWQNKPFNYSYNGEQLTIRLGRSFRRDDTLKIALAYTAQPYKDSTAGGSKAITDEKGLYFINTDLKTPGKPAQIWTQGETESNSRWLPTIDKPNMRTTLQLELTVPDSFKTLANGAWISGKVKGNMRTDIWKMDKPIQVYAIMFAIGNFSIVKDSWRGKDVHYYVEPEYAPYARSIFRHTPEMMEFFSNVTGVEYPWNKYNQIVVRDYVSGAMENTSASLFGEFMNMDNRELLDKTFEDVVSHELFHQWFGDYATAESWSNLTVNESFANYGEYLWRKYKYGKANADQLAYEDLQKYINSTPYGDPVLVRFHYADKEDMFDRISYQKGGATLHYMHTLMGDTAFYKAMNLYLTRNALKPAEATHWRLAVEEATGQDWNWFFNQWYLRGGHPILDVQTQADDNERKITVTVSQLQDTTAPAYRLPLKTAVLNEDGTKQIVQWDINSRKQTFTYAYRGTQAPVIVPDIEHVLPGTIKEHKSFKEWQTQLQRTDDYVSKLNAVKSVKTKDLPNADAMSLMEKALSDKIADIRKDALYTIAGTQAESQRRKWQQDVIMMATNDPDNSVRATCMYIIGLWKLTGQEDLLLQSLNDSSYLVAGQAMYALNKVSADKAYPLAKQMITGRPGTNLDEKSWSVIDERAQPEDTTLYRRYVTMQAAGKRNYLVNHLSVYAAHVKDNAAYRSVIGMMSYTIARVENKNARIQFIGKLGDLYNKYSKQTTGDKETNRQRLAWLQEEIRNLKTAEHEAEVTKRYDDLLKIR